MRSRRVRGGDGAVLVLPGCTTPRRRRPSRPSWSLRCSPSSPFPRAWAVAPAEGGVHGLRPLPIGTGWGPTADEIERARAMVGDLTLRQRAGPGDPGALPGNRGPEHAGQPAAPRGSRRVQRQHRRCRPGQVGQPGPAALGAPSRARLPGDASRSTRRAAWSSASPPAPASPPSCPAGAAGDPGLTRRAAAASASELAGLGFTTDFAPVADVSVGRADVAIGSRAAGSDPAVVATHAVAGRARLLVARSGADPQALPGTRRPHHRQPPRPARPAPLGRPARRHSTSCPSERRSRRGCRASWSVTSTCARSTAACRRRCPARSSPASCASDSASTGSS